jgi:hypothetical protein
LVIPRARTDAHQAIVASSGTRDVIGKWLWGNCNLGANGERRGGAAESDSGARRDRVGKYKFRCGVNGWDLVVAIVRADIVIQVVKGR